MGGETERWREGKMEADKKVRESGMEGEGEDARCEETQSDTMSEGVERGV